MSHHIYHTKAYVIGSVPVGEANRSLILLTEDLGLIQVSAQGVRLQKSKLRQSIQDFSFINVSLVRGKEVWRLTNAQKLISLFDKRVSIEIRKLLIELLQFINRLTPRETPVSEVFELMNTYAGFCFEHKEIALQYIVELKASGMLRMLELLGYGTAEEILVPISKSAEITVSVLDAVRQHIKQCTLYIDQALRDSHL
jgi:recombinational DNA repair protein (RecF pathway)